MAKYRSISDRLLAQENEYIGENASTAGAGRGVIGGRSAPNPGRGGQGGPTAKELNEYQPKQEASKYRSLESANRKDGESALPVSGGYEYIGENASKAGAGRGSKQAALKKGGSVSSASKRADGIAQRGKTRA